MGAERQEVLQVGQPRGYRSDADGGETTRPDRLDHFGQVDGTEPLEDQEFPG